MVHQARATFAGSIDAYPLAPMQAGMLFHAAQGLRGVDVQQVICELPELVDPACCRQAWRDIFRRHGVLRTTFEWLPSGEPRQVINPPASCELPFALIEQSSDHAGRRGLAEYLDSDRAAGFPSLQHPLLRVALITSPTRPCWVVVTYHHLLLDARSLALLFREVLDRQDDLMAGQAQGWTDGPAYRNFVDWVGRQDATPALPFWRTYLDGLASATPAPAARWVEEGRPTNAGVGELMVRVSSDITQRLRDVAQREGVTLHTLAQAAWSLVLSRYTGLDDVVFGALRSGRHVPVDGADQILGLLINTVPVRVRFTPERRVRDWLRELRAAWVAMRPYEHTPLALVQRCSAVPSERRLFETLLNFQDPAWDETLRRQGGKWAQRQFEVRSQPNYPLALDVYAGAALTTKCFFETAVYDAETVARVLAHFQTALMAFAEPWPEFVRELRILPDRERAALIAMGHGKVHAIPEATVLAAFETCAARAPDALAVTDASTQLTYQELNTRADYLADQLRRLGVTREIPVAVCMDRSAAMVVAWLAIWKAGGAFVPLDPVYPADRLAFQITDCGAAVVLVSPVTKLKIQALAPAVRMVEVTAETNLLQGATRSLAVRPAEAHDLAYIIYTSGSTGQPKGVAVEHRALSNLVAWHQRTYRVTPADRATHVASPAFDASVWEIWPYLAAGASVHLPNEETRLAPQVLWEWLAEQRITLSFLPTPLAEAIMREKPRGPISVRQLLTGGDRLLRRPADDFPTELVNHYGPTECTVVATAATVTPGASNVLPVIGRPIANLQAYVLDHYRRLVPVGVHGELYLGGAGLARGYWRRPELTAEKFVHVVLTPGDEPIRLYRTGDVVRWTQTGELEYVGRSDRQVKIRGCRIELGDIEAALRSHPDVEESLVMARNDGRGELHLVAYVAFRSSVSDAGEQAVMRHLRSRLPAAMVPAAVVRVATWPLTVNGKIDRDALPLPTIAAAPDSSGEQAPRTATERLVADIWGAVLGRAVASSREHFFEMGGHSLLAAQVVARLNSALTASVSVRVLFDHPTLRDFAQAVDAGLRTAVAPSRDGPARLKSRRVKAALELAPPI